MGIDQLSAAASRDVVRKPSTEVQKQRNLDPGFSDDSIDDLIKSSSDSDSGKNIYIPCY